MWNISEGWTQKQRPRPYCWEDKKYSFGNSLFLYYLRKDGVVIDMWFLTDVDKGKHVTKPLGVFAKNDYDACLHVL